MPSKAYRAADRMRRLPLPARRLFKINVAFDVTETSVGGDLARAAAKPASAYAPPSSRPTSLPKPLDAADRALVRALQETSLARCVPLLEPHKSRRNTRTGRLERRGRSHAVVARKPGCPSFRRDGSPSAHGVRRQRDGRVGRARRQVLSAGAVLATPLLVSHCYERPRCADVAYNLYTMIHGYDRASLPAHGKRTAFRPWPGRHRVRPPRLLYSRASSKDVNAILRGGTMKSPLFRATVRLRCSLRHAGASPAGVNSPVRAFANVGALRCFTSVLSEAALSTWTATSTLTSSVHGV